MEELLREWKLEDLVKIFLDHSIDLEAFKLLREEDFAELVPQLGPRRKLIQRWRDTLVANAEIVVIQSTNGISSDNISNTAASNYSSSTDPILVETLNETLTSDTITLDDSYKEQESELLQFLNSTNEGKEILAHYTINGELKRRLLVKLIINKELEQDPDKRISRERFIRLSKEICQIFEEESESSYYIPPKRDIHGRPVSGHRNLWDKYINTRSKYRKLAIIKKKLRHKISGD